MSLITSFSVIFYCYLANIIRSKNDQNVKNYVELRKDIKRHELHTSFDIIGSYVPTFLHFEIIHMAMLLQI